jgi:hypothetical protein
MRIKRFCVSGTKESETFVAHLPREERADEPVASFL